MEELKNYLRKKRLCRKRIKDHKRFYKQRTGKTLNLRNPKDFNEKIHWLILNYYGKKEAKLADKELVKKYVKKLKIPNLKIPKTLATYNSVDEIDINKLPNKFVLKCNHFSGNVFICKNKRNFDFDYVKKQLREIMKCNFADINLEYHYSYIKPLIIAEEYLDDGMHKNPIDYKIYCFDGKPESFLICSNREKQVKFNDYDLNWEELNYATEKYYSFKHIKKPKKLKEMIVIAEKLSAGLPFVRVDLYEIGESIYFGEYTFTPGAGIIEYYKQEALDYLGSKIKLNL